MTTHQSNDVQEELHKLTQLWNRHSLRRFDAFLLLAALLTGSFEHPSDEVPDEVWLKGSEQQISSFVCLHGQTTFWHYHCSGSGTLTLSILSSLNLQAAEYRQQHILDDDWSDFWLVQEADEDAEWLEHCRETIGACCRWCIFFQELCFQGRHQQVFGIILRNQQERTSMGWQESMGTHPPSHSVIWSLMNHNKE